jgi:transcription elongation factor GreA
MGDTYLTKEGLAKLQAEHKALLQQKRELTEEVSKAAAHGDLRENGEYHAARERLQHVAKRLAEVDGKLGQVKIVDDLDVKADEARIGAVVTLRDLHTKETFAYTLVGADEADPQQGKLSIASPLGKAMLGKKAGEKFVLALPRAMVNYQIVKIAR